MELSQAHEIIYSHLMDLHRQDPNFRFLIYPNRAKVGGSTLLDNNNLELSFWDTTLNDYFVLVSPIGFSISTNNTAYIHIAVRADDSLDKIKYFEEMAEKLKFIVRKREYIKVWEKELPFTGNYMKLIDDFIKKDKNIIDNYLKENNSFGSSLNLISENSFEQNIALNTGSIKLYLDNITKQQKTCVLKYLKVENYQGIKSLCIKDLPNDAQWIFLTGENGFGKTSILRAIAKGLLGDEERVTQINDETNIFSSLLGLDDYVYAHVVQKGQKITPYYKGSIFGYGISRFNLSDDINYGKAYTLFEDDGRLLNIEKLLLTSDESNFEKIKTILKKIIPNLADIKKIKNKGFYEIQYQEKSENEDIFTPVLLKDLAAGYRGIITMIGDMIRRIVPFPELSIEDIGEGIVIIDEFDAHLHPKYQYELPKLLSTVFPKIQFIVSTHSPIPILGVEPNTAVVLTVNRTKELGITVDRLDDDIDIDRLSANALLTSDIFGFKTIFARGATPDTIEPFDDYKDIKEMNELEKRMELKQGFKDLNIKIG